MTKYPPEFFLPTETYVSQFVLACIAQNAANTYFINNDRKSTDTNYAQDAVNVSISTDNLDNAVCSIDVRLPVMQKTPLLNKVDLAERVVSMTNVYIDRLSIPRESVYLPRGGYTVSYLPPYLQGGSDDILERRIAHLALQISNLCSWAAEWNLYCKICNLARVAAFFPDPLSGLPTPLSLDARANLIRVVNVVQLKKPFFFTC